MDRSADPEYPADGHRPDQLAASLHALAGMLLSDEDLDDTLHRVAQLAVAGLPTCDMAYVTLVRDGQPVTRGATDARAQQFDAVQYRTGDGPCLAAWRTNRISRLDSAQTDVRWPELADAARTAGIRSVMAVPLQVREAAIGALNLYSTREQAFGDHDGEVGQLFADQAVIALENAKTHAAAVTLAGQLREALASRGRIEQAKGVLIARHGCTPDTAFEMLVAQSQDENRKLRVVADDIVAIAQNGAGPTTG